MKLPLHIFLHQGTIAKELGKFEVYLQKIQKGNSKLSA